MTATSDMVLAKVDQARLLLSEARTVREAKQIADMAKAAEVYGRRQRASQEAIGYAREISVEAQRLLGEFLAASPKNSGAKGVGPIAVTESNRNTIPKLSDHGISKRESADAQLLATVAVVSPHLFEAVKSGKKSITEVKREVKRDKATNPEVVRESGITADIASLCGRKFACIYADPPWRYSNQGTRAATDNHYSTMTVEEICALPIRELAAEQAHLHLWTTNGFLFECPRIFEAWGFEFKSSFVWVKPQMGIGNYWRNSHEIMLLAVRGGLTARDKSQMSWLQCSRGEHSSKPDKIRESIEKLSPGPYLELFGRGPRDGWVVFGNQVMGSML